MDQRFSFSAEAKAENPFLSWIEEVYRESDQWYVPSAETAKKVMTVLNATADDIIRVQQPVGSIITHLWGSDFLEEFKTEIVEGHVIFQGQAIPIVENSEVGRDEDHELIIYVGGWMSLPHLNKWLGRAIHGSPNPNANNPFNAFVTHDQATFLPDVSYLDQLYHELEVSRFEELEFEELDLTARSYANLFIGFNFTIGLGGRIHYEDEIIGVLDVTHVNFEVFYLERFPKRFIQHIKISMANRREARGQIAALDREPFQAITQGGLRGKDLIALCVSNPQVNRKCNANNQAIFKERLREEFKVVWKPDLWGFQTPRELYRHMHIKFFVLDTYMYNDVLYYSVITIKDGIVVSPILMESKRAIVVPSSEFLEQTGKMNLTFVYIKNDPESSFVMEETEKPVSELITTKLPSYVTNHRFWSSRTPDLRGILSIILGSKYDAVFIDIWS